MEDLKLYMPLVSHFKCYKSHATEKEQNFMFCWPCISVKFM